MTTQTAVRTPTEIARAFERMILEPEKKFNSLPFSSHCSLVSEGGVCMDDDAINPLTHIPTLYYTVMFVRGLYKLVISGNPRTRLNYSLEAQSHSATFQDLPFISAQIWRPTKAGEAPSRTPISYEATVISERCGNIVVHKQMRWDHGGTPFFATSDELLHGTPVTTWRPSGAQDKKAFQANLPDWLFE